jgi:hypothetical protein
LLEVEALLHAGFQSRAYVVERRGQVVEPIRQLAQYRQHLLIIDIDG